MSSRAFYGGTFDPPHRGHLAVARAAADFFSLDQVLFTPVGRQPLKQGQPSASFADRLQMVKLACEADVRFRVCTLDRPRADGEANYTVSTLRKLKQRDSASEKRWPQSQVRRRLYAISGADSFLSIASWREPHHLLELAEWIVVSRPGYALAPPAALELTEAECARIHLLPTVHEEVSATELRRRLGAGQPCEDLLPAKVAAYIAQQGLYRTPAEAPALAEPDNPAVPHS